MGNTKVDLIKDLEPYLKKFGGEKKQNLINLMERAYNGYYHDFDSELATPKLQLIHDLDMLGLTVQKKKVMNGDYDDKSPTPEQHQELMDLLMKK